MTAQRILYITGFVILLFILMWQLSEAAAYPPEIQKRIDGAEKIICEIQTPRKVSTIAYIKDGGLIRIFAKDGEELEIWLNESMSWFSLYFILHDKVFFYENSQWLDQDTVSEEEARRLDRRLKFTGEEKQFFKECFEQKRNTAP